MESRGLEGTGGASAVVAPVRTCASVFAICEKSAVGMTIPLTI